MKPRGFQKLSSEERRKISSLGGIVAHAMGVAHRWTPEEARIAGRKGKGRRWKDGFKLQDSRGDTTDSAPTSE